jgi:hypothetical protein
VMERRFTNTPDVTWHGYEPSPVAPPPGSRSVVK